MALIPLSDWIDRYGVLDEASEAGPSMAGDLPAEAARHGRPAIRIAAARDRLRVLLHETWTRHSPRRLTLRRS